MPPRRSSLPPTAGCRSSPAAAYSSAAASSPLYRPPFPSPAETSSTPSERRAVQIEKGEDEGDGVLKKNGAVGKDQMDLDEVKEQPPRQKFPQEDDGRDAGEGENGGDEDRWSDSEYEIEETIPESQSYVVCRRGDLKSEFMCMICIGILRKTSTVKKCLHRFCRECIDRTIRSGNPVCPTCRNHFASRRDLADDPLHDSIIAAIFPDIEKYEKECLTLTEEEEKQRIKTQAAIAAVLLQQLYARRKKGKAATATYSRRSRGGSRVAAHRTTISSSVGHDMHSANVTDANRDSLYDRKQQRSTRGAMSTRFSPARAAKTVDNLEINRENAIISPRRAGIGEMLAWGKNAARSQTRHAHATTANACSNSSVNDIGRMRKGVDIAKLTDYLRHQEENDDQLDVHLNLVSLDKELPNLERPHLCCRPTALIGHLCKLIADQMHIKAEEVQLYSKKRSWAAAESSSAVRISHYDPLLGRLEKLEEHESLAALLDSFIKDDGELDLLYSLKRA